MADHAEIVVPVVPVARVEAKTISTHLAELQEPIGFDI